MATHYFTGPCRWARLQAPDQKYQKYSIALKLEGDQLKEYYSLKLKGRPDQDGYVNFSSYPNKKTGAPADKPDVVLDGKPFDGLVGNDSDCTVKIETYSYDNAHGKGNGSRLKAVKINKLVEFVKEEVGLPVTPTANPSPSRPKILF